MPPMGKRVPGEVVMCLVSACQHVLVIYHFNGGGNLAGPSNTYQHALSATMWTECNNVGDISNLILGAYRSVGTLR